MILTSSLPPVSQPTSIPGSSTYHPQMEAPGTPPLAFLLPNRSILCDPCCCFQTILLLFSTLTLALNCMSLDHITCYFSWLSSWTNLRSHPLFPGNITVTLSSTTLSITVCRFNIQGGQPSSVLVSQLLNLFPSHELILHSLYLFTPMIIP